MVGLNQNDLSQTARLESCRTSIDKIFNFDKSQVANKQLSLIMSRFDSYIKEVASSKVKENFGLEAASLCQRLQPAKSLVTKFVAHRDHNNCGVPRVQGFSLLDSCQAYWFGPHSQSEDFHVIPQKRPNRMPK